MATTLRTSALNQIARSGRAMQADVHAGNRVRRDAGWLMDLSYKPLPEAAHAGARRGYNLDPELSSENTKVFVHQASGRPLVAHRGSKTFADWIVDDTMIATGKTDFSPRHWKARNVTKQAKNKYKRPVDAVGHSLGGRLAEHGGGDGHIVTYNKAAGINDVFSRPGKNWRQLDMRTEGDVVSLLASRQNNTQTLPAPQSLVRGSPLTNAAQAHSLDNIRDD